MLRWESYRAVYGAELRAAAREYSDHGWPVVGACSAGLLLATGTALDVLEVPAAVGRQVCARLRAAGLAVPVAATPTGRWWFPVTAGAVLPAALRDRAEVVLHTDGAAVLAPPSETPDGWVHWRVAPALSGYRPSPAGPIVAAVLAAIEEADAEHTADRAGVAVAARP
jgi:Bifunctional DNA primase/polymerase, N-terminal